MPRNKTTNKLIMSTKPKTSAPPSASGNAAPADQPTFGATRKWMPKLMPTSKRTRSIGTTSKPCPATGSNARVVLNEVRELDRQQRMREGDHETASIANPELKQRLRNAGERPAGRPEGRRHRPNRPHRAARGRPRARPATKAGRCWRLNQPPRLDAVPPAFRRGEILNRQFCVRAELPI